jgi:hypothetical protein
MSYVPDSTLRACDYPQCGAVYDALAVMTGTAHADGWRHHPTFGLHMCGAHAGVWSPDGPDAHRPALNRLTAACSCGHPLTAAPGTLGAIKADYLRHLTATTSNEG